jgi:hypothetical protein
MSVVFVSNAVLSSVAFLERLLGDITKRQGGRVLGL